MTIKYKTANAAVLETDSEFPGTFEVILSTADLDRDGDELYADEWKQPLPDRIQFNSDHNHNVEATVGSAVPTIENDRLVCRGTYAETDHAQNVRKLIRGKHIGFTSVAYKETKAKGANGAIKASRELINGSFVVVPSNPNAVVVEGKSAKTPLDVKRALKGVTEEQITVSADFFAELMSKAAKPKQKPADNEGDDDDDDAEDDGEKSFGAAGIAAATDFAGGFIETSPIAMGIVKGDLEVELKGHTLTVKQAGEVVHTQEFSPTPEVSPEQGAVKTPAPSADTKAADMAIANARAQALSFKAVE